ncbi:MAG: flagellar export chaperone FlgN [Dethiobacter sp.]|jgi:hypothetical protein|nr:flagellar export chaperone FlgN [Dethiobacter sp.]
MLEAALITVLEEEAAILSGLKEAMLKEREGIVNCNPALLTESLQVKEKLKASLAALEKKREMAVNNKSLREIIQQAAPEQQERLTSLQFELNVSAREARVLSKANILLFKQSMALVAQLQEGISHSYGHPYNESGEYAARKMTGKLVSSSA